MYETFLGFFSINSMLLKFQKFALKPEVFKMGGNFQLQSFVGYNLVVNVQNDTWFGLSFMLTRCTIFKICSQFSENAIFEKIVKILFLH